MPAQIAVILGVISVLAELFQGGSNLVVRVIAHVLNIAICVAVLQLVCRYVSVGLSYVLLVAPIVYTMFVVGIAQGIQMSRM